MEVSQRNREAGNYDQNDDWEEGHTQINFTKNIEDEEPEIQQMGATHTSQRPQTSHGRGRTGVKGGGYFVREEKTVGLGETTKDLWEEKDESRKQMLKEAAEIAKAEKAEAGFRRQARPGAAKKPQQKQAFEEDNIDDLDNLMGDSNKKIPTNDFDDFFGGQDDDDFVPKKKKGKANDDPLAFL